MMMGSRLPLEVRSILIEYLQANVDRFSISPYEMPDINPTVAYHKLNVEHGAYYISQQ